jgi:cell division protein FtsI (penicillin-binding protein 3)
MRPQRLFVLGGLIAVAALLLTGRLFYWQVSQAGRLREQIVAQHELDETVPAKRGSVYDANGDLLAGSVSVDYVYAVPRQIKKPDEAAVALAPLLGMESQDLLPALSDKEKGYVRLANGRKMLPAESEHIRALGLAGIFLEPTTNRTYPGGPLGAHILGLVDNEGTGWYGLEGQYGGQIGGPVAGTPGRLRAERDTAGNEIGFSDRQYQPPIDGKDLVLTIDRTVQYIAERELDRAIVQHKASGGSVLVMDPKTGAILAMANRPTFDPNQFDQYLKDPSIFVNPSVSSQFEPGSTFKLITMAAALNEHLVQPETTYYDSGVLSLGGFTIRNWDFKANGVTNMTQLLEKSSNIGAAWVARDKLGPERFYRYVKAFGFGQPTGIDLQGEGVGIVKQYPSKDWYDVDLATNAFGQAISVTPIQLVSAVSAIANGGIMMRPFVVRQVVDPHTKQVVSETQPQIVRQVIGRDTANTLLTMMFNAAENGETRGTLVPGFKVAGKTGTASIPDPVNGGYDSSTTIASFIGAVPADDPQFVILVKIDKPTDEPWGSLIAKPAFAIIGQELTRYRRMRPTEPIRTPTPSPAPRATPTAPRGAVATVPSKPTPTQQPRITVPAAARPASTVARQ